MQHAVGGESVDAGHIGDVVEFNGVSGVYNRNGFAGQSGDGVRTRWDVLAIIDGVASCGSVDDVVGEDVLQDRGGQRFAEVAKDLRVHKGERGIIRSEQSQTGRSGKAACQQTRRVEELCEGGEVAPRFEDRRQIQRKRKDPVDDVDDAVGCPVVAAEDLCGVDIEGAVDSARDLEHLGLAKQGSQMHVRKLQVAIITVGEKLQVIGHVIGEGVGVESRRKHGREGSVGGGVDGVVLCCVVEQVSEPIGIKLRNQSS